MRHRSWWESVIQSLRLDSINIQQVHPHLEPEDMGSCCSKPVLCLGTGDPSISFNRVLSHSSQVLLSGKKRQSELSRRHRLDSTAEICLFQVVTKETEP